MSKDSIPFDFISFCFDIFRLVSFCSSHENFTSDNTFTPNSPNIVLALLHLVGPSFSFGVNFPLLISTERVLFTPPMLLSRAH